MARSLPLSLENAGLLISNPGFLISPTDTSFSKDRALAPPPLPCPQHVRIHQQFLSLPIVSIFLMGFHGRKIHSVTVTGIFVN